MFRLNPDQLLLTVFSLCDLVTTDRREATRD